MLEIKVGSNDGWAARFVAFFHQFEEAVRMWSQGGGTQSSNTEYGMAREEGGGCVGLIEKSRLD
jgi:hypothetical protein